MTHPRAGERTPLQALCDAVERGLPQETPWSLRRPWKDGWCIFGGPTCAFFVGESVDADGRAWITVGPVARRTEVTGDGREMREEFSYHLREADRRPLTETPLTSGLEAAEVAPLLEELHGLAVDDLGGGALLYDGWVVWGWGSEKLWPTVPGLAGPG